MNNEIQIFNNAEFGNIRTITEEDGTILFCGKDVATALGYTNTKKAIRDHCRWVTKRYLPHPQAQDKEIEITFIPEGDLYRLICNSKLPSAEKFERWVFDEVLPSIRKHGGYLTPQKIEEALLNPDTIIKLATELKAERVRRAALEAENAKKEQVIAELKPKADYTDNILRNRGLVTITQIAKDYGMSGNAMNAMLHDLGVQYKLGDQWLLYAKHQSKGYTHSDTFEFEHKDGRKDIRMHTKWTQKGRLFLYNLLKSNDVLPLIERD